MASSIAATTGTTTSTTTPKVTGSLTEAQKKRLDEIMAKQNSNDNGVAKNQEMGKDQFMRLLLEQMTHQDPMNPMEDKDSIAQMAQFSSLEQMSKINTSLETLTTAVTAGNTTLGKLDTSMTALLTQIKDLGTKFSTTDESQKKQLDSIVSDAAEIRKLISEAKAEAAYQ